MKPVAGRSACAFERGRAGPAGDAGRRAPSVSPPDGRQPRRHGRPQGKRPRRSDRGSGTVWALTFMMVIWLMAVPAMMAAGGRAARHRAFAAADLAALAAAAHAAEGPRAACRQAVTIARASGGSVSACVLNGRIADVTVTVPLRGPAALGAVRARARARAGPVDPEP